MLNGSSNIKWLCRSGFYIFFPLTYTHNKANGNGIECGSEINATRHKRRLFTLPFVRTKRESIWAYDKMKLLLAASVCEWVSACTPQLTQKQHIKEMKETDANYGHTCDFSPCISMQCIHELDRPSSFSCWIKAKSIARALTRSRTLFIYCVLDT